MFKSQLKKLLIILINVFLLNFPLNSLALTTILKEENQCPRDLEILTNQLLNDLPNYANRVIQRSRRLDREVDIYYTVILAGKPEFEPLELFNTEYIPFAPDEQPEQVFFTTLERSYTNTRIIETQSYHWLFLTQTSRGWQSVMMFSQNGSSFDNLPPSPPRESSDTGIGMGVKLWLRDCNALNNGQWTMDN